MLKDTKNESIYPYKIASFSTIAEEKRYLRQVGKALNQYSAWNTSFVNGVQGNVTIKPIFKDSSFNFWHGEHEFIIRGSQFGSFSLSILKDDNSYLLAKNSFSEDSALDIEKEFLSMEETIKKLAFSSFDRIYHMIKPKLDEAKEKKKQLRELRTKQINDINNSFK